MTLRSVSKAEARRIAQAAEKLKREDARIRAATARVASRSSSSTPPSSTSPPAGPVHSPVPRPEPPPPAPARTPAAAMERAAKAGDYDSASCLATFYLTGTGGVTKNELAAVYWSRCAAEGGVHNNRIYSIIYSCEEAPGPLRQWALVMLAVKGVDEFRVQLEMETMKESVVRVNAEWLPTPEEVAADAAARQEIAERAAGAAAGVAGVTGAAAAAS